jgi:hypothetical protein
MPYFFTHSYLLPLLTTLKPSQVNKSKANAQASVSSKDTGAQI